MMRDQHAQDRHWIIMMPIPIKYNGKLKIWDKLIKDWLSILYNILHLWSWLMWECWSAQEEWLYCLCSVDPLLIILRILSP